MQSTGHFMTDEGLAKFDAFHFLAVSVCHRLYDVAADAVMQIVLFTFPCKDKF